MGIAIVILHDTEKKFFTFYSRLKEFTVVEWKSSLIRSIRLNQILLDLMSHTFYYLYVYFIAFWALLLEWSSIYHIPRMFWPLIYQLKFELISVHVEGSYMYIQGDY